jgi:two-component system response regulator FixJ
LREINAYGGSLRTSGAMLSPQNCQQWIVLVDDDPGVRGALAFAFETEGICIKAFESAEAMLAAPPIAAACYVIDQRLPGMSGLDLVANLRAQDVQAPAILITSHPDARVRAKAHAAGVEIVEKPLLGEVLANRVRAYAGGALG